MDSYTLILSRGTHVVSAAAAETILRALDARAPVVSVDLDVLCDGFVRRNVALVMSHVIALIPNEAEYDAHDQTFGAAARLN